MGQFFRMHHRELGIHTWTSEKEHRAHGVVVSRLLRMQKALGSNPSGSTFFGVKSTKR
jgi:hypothetical protein